MLIDSPRSASFNSLTKATTESGLSNTAATVVGPDTPFTTVSKSRAAGPASRCQCTVARITHVHRIVFASNFKEAPLLFDSILVVDAARWNREHDIVVLETFARSVTMQSIRHIINGCALSGLHSQPLMGLGPTESE